MSRTRTGAPPRTVELEMNGETVEAKEDQTILEVAQQQGIEIPTMCWERTLTPVNACRVCVVEIEGARVLAPSCARKVEDGMEIQTHSERVNHSRKMVLEFLASSVDLSVMPNVARWIEEYGADPERYGPPAPPFEAGERDRVRAGHHETPDGQPRRHRAPADEGRQRALRARLLEVHPLLQVRRGLRHRLAEHVRHRRRRARVRRPHRHRVRQPAARLRVRLLRQLHRRLPHRRADVQERVRPPRGRPLGREQADQTTTICTYCGVGCNLELHEQDNEIVKVTSPLDHPVTRGNLCIKGRFGFQFIQNHEEEEPPEFLEILERGGGAPPQGRHIRTDMRR